MGNFNITSELTILLSTNPSLALFQNCRIIMTHHSSSPNATHRPSLDEIDVSAAVAQVHRCFISVCFRHLSIRDGRMMPVISTSRIAPRRPLGLDDAHHFYCSYHVAH